MAELSKLVDGGVHKGMSPPYPDEERGTFLIHTPPVIYDDTIVVAATHPTVASGHQKDDGWFLSDFYAFNYLLKGSVADQVWLTAAQPEKLLERHGNFLHGHPSECPRIVLSPELLGSEITPVTIVQPAKMIDKFLDEVRQAAARAKRSNCPLLLMVFCHGIENFELCLDNGTRHKGLSIVRLKEALEPGVRVTLLSTACYSGGWVVDPDFNTTTMAAADAEGQSISWPLSASMGRACGSVFAGAIINTLSGVSTPLLPRDEASAAPETEERLGLQPEDPTEAQTDTYNEFCRTVTTTLGARGISSALLKGFRFSAQNDQWEYTWTRRTAIPLARFRDRWERLPIYPRQVFHDASSIESSHLAGSTHITDQEHARVYGMAEQFYRLCPGDWNAGPNVSLASKFFSFLKGLPDAPSASEIADVIKFRWEACLMADKFVRDHNLRRPNQEICVRCHLREFKYGKQDKFGHKVYDPWYARHMLTWIILRDNGGKMEPAEHQGPDFIRPCQYVSFAIAETYNTPETEEDAIKAAQAYCDYLASYRQFYLDQVIRSSDIQRKGRNWLRSIGRRVRRSPSPSKGSRLSLVDGMSGLGIGGSGDAQSKKLGKAPSLQPLRQQGPADDELL
ncbi:hypothetical protein B0T25DRAFT_508455 [Lasiosphaeria hispida]|uniref:Uncharacterized protein n=1 Tax=Lasiosphaeria hispida TaxID=260671 RepID=A0AAJ0H841_9PEZI|nr:hypothetical protein B0T25DRAFT_586598 [Lasiosphaeria hispida]KAK3343550.1 hypothetical protein B0T25DRAFT_508455 [Lasiosphaeria hispida]